MSRIKGNNVLGIKKKSNSYWVNEKLKLSKIYIGKGFYYEFTQTDIAVISTSH